MKRLPTSEQIRAVVAEINAWATAAYPEEVEAGEWRIHRVEFLRSLQEEAYRITYTDGYQSLFQRDAYDGELCPIAAWSYEAQHNFEDRHPQGSAPESEADHV